MLAKKISPHTGAIICKIPFLTSASYSSVQPCSAPQRFCGPIDFSDRLTLLVPAIAAGYATVHYTQQRQSKKNLPAAEIPKLGAITIQGSITTTDKFHEALHRCRTDATIKGIILKIDADWGELSICKVMFQELKSAAREKPIIALIEKSCCREAYLVATAADLIIANDHATIGMIGTSSSFVVEQRLDPNKEVFTFYAGKHTTLGELHHRMTPEEQQIIAEQLELHYQQMCTTIAAERHLDLAELEIWAEGKPFLGKQALDLNLIDALGTLSDAYEAMSDLLAAEKRRTITHQPFILIPFTVDRTDHQLRWRYGNAAWKFMMLSKKPMKRNRLSAISKKFVHQAPILQPVQPAISFPMKLARVGSIGVVQTIEKIEPSSFKRDGVKGTLTIHRFKKGKHKQLGSAYDPITDEERKLLEQEIDMLHHRFCSDVAYQRGLTKEDVAAQESLTFTGTEALDLGLIDQIGDFDDALSALSNELSYRGIHVRGSAYSAHELKGKFDTVQQSWQLWLNGATTRRNPRTPLPYPDVTEIDCYYANLFAQGQNYVNSAYCNALSSTIEKDSVIESQAVTNYIEQVRSEARIAIAKTVISALADLETTLASIQTMLTCVQSKKFIHTMQTLAKEVQDQKDKSFIDDGIQFVLNNLALQAFAQCDKNYLATSDQFFNVLADTQTLYIALWDQLETARANYYQGIYETVYNCMIDLEFPSSSFLLAIDADGRIDIDEQTEPLPATLL
ncbi:unnamed protein product [Sphagnum balticum]